MLVRARPTLIIHVRVIVRMRNLRKHRREREARRFSFGEEIVEGRFAAAAKMMGEDKRVFLCVKTIARRCILQPTCIA